MAGGLMFAIYGYDEDGNRELYGEEQDSFGAEMILNEALYEGYGYIRVELWQDGVLIEAYST
jgi:hypothetical protein